MAKALCVAICDDSHTWLELSREYLTSYGRQHGMELDISTYDSGQSLFDGQHVAPDVLFSDIEFGDQRNGIDLVRRANEAWPSCQIVYVTNHLRYAPEVYVTKHLWYVLKDDFERRLPEIMDKLASQLEESTASVMVKATDHRLHSLSCLDIVSIERHGRVSLLHTVDGGCYELSDRIPSLLERLPWGMFVRCHGSFAVNLAHVRMVGQTSVTLDDGSEIPVSRRFAPSLRGGYVSWADRHMV